MKYGPSIVPANFSVFFLDFDVVGGLINDRFPHSDTLVQVQVYLSCHLQCLYIMQFGTFIAHADIDTQLKQLVA